MPMRVLNSALHSETMNVYNLIAKKLAAEIMIHVNMEDCASKDERNEKKLSSDA